MTPLGAAQQRLLSVAGPALTPSPPTLAGDGLVAELSRLLAERNGFYAFESALHVLGSGTVAGEASLEEWNDAGGWRAEYGDLAGGHLFFAEDAFGTQFSIASGQVWLFDPETAEPEPLAASIEGWAQALLDDWQVLTGHKVARAWQEQSGPLPVGERLVPVRPFVLGGDFAVANVVAMDAERGMRVRGELARQLVDLPDGATVRYRVGD